MRENGYYWVLDGDRWRVSKYEKGYGWQICSSNEYFESDEDFKEIDKNQIVCKSTTDNILYEFIYNSCIHESSWATMSIHITKECAVNAMNKHKEEEYKKWLEYDAECRKSDPKFFEAHPNKFGEHENWDV